MDHFANLYYNAKECLPRAQHIAAPHMTNFGFLQAQES